MSERLDNPRFFQAKFVKEALIVFVLLVFMYGYFYQNPGANGNSRFGLVFAMVKQRRLTIDSFYQSEGTRTIDVSFYKGHYYSDKAPGTAILGAVFYAPMYLFMKLTGYQFDLTQVDRVMTFMAIGIPSALTGSLVYILCATISGSRLRAYLATLAVCLGTMVLPFSAIFFGHVLAGALAFSSFFLIFEMKLNPGLRRLWGYLFFIGFLLGSTFFTEYTTMIIIIPLCLYYLYTLRGKIAFTWFRSTIVPFAMGALIPAVALLVYNTLCFGNPFSIGYENLKNPFTESMAQGFMGISRPSLDVLFYLTFHPAMGLFWQSPVLLMGIVGLFFLLRDNRYSIEGIIIAVVFLAYLLINSGYFLWWGGYSFGPRHLIPMLLFLSLPLVMLPRRLIPPTIILAIISIGQMIIPLAGDTLAPDEYFLQNPHLNFFGYSTIYSYALQQLLEGHYTHNLATALFGWENWLILVPYILVLLLVTVVFIVKVKRLSSNPITWNGRRINTKPPSE